MIALRIKSYTTLCRGWNQTTALAILHMIVYLSHPVLVFRMLAMSEVRPLRNNESIPSVFHSSDAHVHFHLTDLAV